jgi:glycerol kinase
LVDALVEIGDTVSEVVIALDQGSSSSRALAVNAKGRVIARAQYPVESFFPKPGWVEHDPAELSRTLERALDDVLEKVPKSARIVGVGIAAQRSTVVLWDAKTGRPACMAPSWMDGRASEIIAPLQSRQTEIHEKTGLYATPFYSAPKIRYLLDHEPKARALAEEGRLRIGPVTTYLLWKLTGGDVFRVDPALAQRMLLFNIQEGDWDNDMLALFNIPRAALPDVAPTTGDWGELKRKGREMRVLAVMGDQQSAAFGQGGDVEGLGVLNYGTGAFFLLHTGEKRHHIPGLLTSVAWQRKDRPTSYFLEGTVHAAGTSFEWLKTLGLLSNSKAVDQACRKSTHRLWALQAIGGLGAPRWDYKTPTTFMGLQAKTRSEDIVRGVTESIALLVSDIVRAVRGKGLKVEHLRASGGLAKVDYLLQFQSDILQQRITRLQESEATALGAASMAAEVAGMPWADDLRSGAGEIVFEPAIDEQAAAAHLSAWTVFAEGQRKLAAELDKLGAFSS